MSTTVAPPPAARSGGASPRGGLLRVLGTAFGLAVLIGTTIGVGILRTPGEIAAGLPSLWLYLGVWVAGGLYALFGALSLAEMGAMLPRSGGQYIAARRAWGPYVGFVVGWSDWLSTCGTVAAVAIVLAEAAGALLPGLAGYPRLLAIGTVAALLLFQLRGTRWGGWTQGVTSLVKAIGFGVLIASCLLWSGTRTPVAAPAIGVGFALATAVVAALQGVIFTYDGWTGPLYFAGEMRDPGREMPRSMVGGVLAVIAIYLLVNIAFLKVLGIGGMAGDQLVAAKAAGVVFGAAGSRVVSLVVMLAMLGAASANLLIAPRVLYALSGDGVGAPGGTQVNEGGTPVVAALISAGVAVAFLATGTFNSVLAVLAFLFVASYAISFGAVFLLRRREPEAERPYRAWGFPWTTGAALLGSLAFLAGSLTTDPRNSLAALAMVALSYPVYRFLSRGR
jgi:APA family basic amino acid/polyamine antiporter